MSACEEVSYPVVFKKNPNRYSKNKSIPAEAQDCYDGLVSGGVYSWLSQQALNSKGSSKKEACVKEIIQKRDGELKKLQAVLRTAYTPVSDKLDEHRRTLVSRSDQENAAPKPQRSFFASPTGKRIKTRFKGPLIPGLVPKERYYVERLPIFTPAARPQQLEFLLEPIDSALAVEDQTGRDLIKRIQKRHRQLAYLPFQKYDTAENQKPSATATDSFKPPIGESTRKLLLNPNELQVIVSNTIKSLKKRPDFHSITLEPQTINYRLLAESLERPRCTLKLQDRNLELFQLSRKPASSSRRLPDSPEAAEACGRAPQRGRAAASPRPLNVHTLPYLYVSPSI